MDFSHNKIAIAILGKNKRDILDVPLRFSWMQIFKFPVNRKANVAVLFSAAVAVSSAYSQTLASAKAYADAGDWPKK